mgnify:CR=1 FL=1
MHVITEGYVLSVTDQVLTSKNRLYVYNLYFKIRMLMYLTGSCYLLWRQYTAIRKSWKDVQSVLLQYLTTFSGGSIPGLRWPFIIFILLTPMYMYIWGKVRFRM